MTWNEGKMDLRNENERHKKVGTAVRKAENRISANQAIPGKSLYFPTLEQAQRKDVMMRKAELELLKSQVYTTYQRTQTR